MFNFRKLSSNRSLQWAVLTDLIMLGLVVLNLLLLLFNYIFDSPRIQRFFENLTPEFHDWYKTYIYEDFLLIDGLFISIFIAELLIRWGIAIFRKSYYRWFFFPFVHWYDVLGCIPISSFRFFRVLRVFSILFRLQKAEVIDLENSYVFNLVKKYYQILVEEISDRVVVNVLSGAQDEMREGSPVIEKIVNEVLRPRKEILVDWLTDRTQMVVRQTYQQHGEEIKEYLEHLIARAMKDNAELETLELVPMLGGYISRKIESAVKDIVYKVLHEAVADLQSDKASVLVEGITDAAFEVVTLLEVDETLESLTSEMAIQVMEVLKEQVRIQRWKEAAEDTIANNS